MRAGRARTVERRQPLEQRLGHVLELDGLGVDELDGAKERGVLDADAAQHGFLRLVAPGRRLPLLQVGHAEAEKVDARMARLEAKRDEVLCAPALPDNQGAGGQLRLLRHDLEAGHLGRHALALVQRRGLQEERRVDVEHVDVEDRAQVGYDVVFGRVQVQNELVHGLLREL